MVLIEYLTLLTRWNDSKNYACLIRIRVVDVQQSRSSAQTAPCSMHMKCQQTKSAVAVFVKWTTTFPHNTTFRLRCAFFVCNTWHIWRFFFFFPMPFLSVCVHVCRRANVSRLSAFTQSAIDNFCVLVFALDASMFQRCAQMVEMIVGVYMLYASDALTVWICRRMPRHAGNAQESAHRDNRTVSWAGGAFGVIIECVMWLHMFRHALHACQNHPRAM